MASYNRLWAFAASFVWHCAYYKGQHRPFAEKKNFLSHHNIGASVYFFHTSQVACGWKPGAISKRLLRKLNKAKLHYPDSEEDKPAKKLKKRTVEKPTLIISKKNGEYRVEMQVTEEKDKGTEYTPVVYTIANESNAERQYQKDRHKRRVIRKAVEEVWSDPYHPELCETICYKTYQHAIGLRPYDANNPEYICSDEEDETTSSCSCNYSDNSSDSSSDVEWEIHFSPPIAHL